MARIDELRLIAKIARLYHVQGIRQTDISKRLRIHQSTVSRLLRRAEKVGIVRTTVTAPAGIHSEVEEQLEEIFGLKEAIVIESGSDEDTIARDLGGAAAFLLESTVKGDETIGISCWSQALLAMVNALQPARSEGGGKVVQILGGIGNPGVQSHATLLTQRLAHLLLATPVLLPAPGVVGSKAAQNVLLNDPYVQQAMALFTHLDIALVGIGALEPSRMLRSSGNVFSAQEMRLLSEAGAVGDICLQFFDASGVPVRSAFSSRVISIPLQDLTKTPRVIGVAGGQRKVEAILAALRGRWINMLITDYQTATALVAAQGQSNKKNAFPAGARRVASLAGSGRTG
jgi:DNA-binding transcriptional regulator LsrR (DeoR family)